LREFVDYVLYTDEQKHLPVMARIDRFCADRKVCFENIQALKDLGEEFFLGVISASDPYKELSKIEEEFKKCPLFILQVPVNFSEKEIRELGKWVKENVNKRAFVSIKVNPKLGAGCIFSWGNKRYDMSFESKRKEKHRKVSNMIKEKIGRRF
ncbi:MAG: hypothetical protein ACLFTS_02545, partial [Candidatus Paceibacterota bacterium]